MYTRPPAMINLPKQSSWETFEHRKRNSASENMEKNNFDMTGYYILYESQHYKHISPRWSRQLLTREDGSLAWMGNKMKENQSISLQKKLCSPTYSGKGIWIFHWTEIWAIHEGLEFMNSAAGTSQQREKVEDVAQVLKNCWRFCDLLQLLVFIQGALFSGFTYNI